MDTNIRDVLLVLLGALSSLLATALTLFFELRRDRQAGRRERQTKQHEELVAYLFSMSRLYSLVIDYFATINSGMSYPREEFQTNVNNALNRIDQSPLNGLPPVLMTRDRAIQDKLSEFIDRAVDVKVLLNLIRTGGYTSADKELVKGEVKKLEELNEIIEGIIDKLERAIV